MILDPFPQIKITLNVLCHIRKSECLSGFTPPSPTAQQVEPVDKMTYFPELESFDMERSTPMTIRTHSDVLPSATTEVQGTYIECTKEPSFFGEIAARAKSDGMRHVSIKAGHYVIITHSDEVVKILQEASLK